MPLFSPAAESMLRTRGALPDRPLPEPADPFANALQKAASSLSRQMIGIYGRERARDSQLKDTSFIAANNVAQNRFDWELKRELGKFYTSDGRDLTPEEGYSKDLGFGISLSPGDFTDSEAGDQRRTYTDLVKHMHEKFMDARLQAAPSDRAETMSRIRLERGKLAGEVGAMNYSAKRREVILANNLNAVVRAYKENLSGTRGYDPHAFGLHVNAILEASDAKDSVDPGRARMAALAAINDLVRVGVTESHTDRDNQFALAALAATPLRNTGMVEGATAGLSEADKKYIKGLATVGRKNGYKRGDALPGDKVEDYLPWAMAQLSMKETGEIQGRAVRALTAQTQVARGELEERLKGIGMAMNSAQVKEPGFREMLRNSLQESMRLSNRLYPKNLFPVEHARNAAAVLTAGELLEMRSTLDNTDTSTLAGYLRDGSLGAAIASKVSAGLGSSSSTLYAQATIARAAKISSNFISAELKARWEDPYGSVIRTTKDVKELERKLSEGDYASDADRMRDQATLRKRVKQRAMELGVRPSFLTGADAGTLKNLAAMGNPVMTEQYVRKMRDKYGELTFFENILPDIANDKVVGPATLSYAMLPQGQVWQLFAAAQADAPKSRESLKTLGFEEDKLRAELQDITKESFWESPWSLWGLGFGADVTMEGVNNAITDRFGDGYAGQRARVAASEAIRNMSISLLATGRESDVRGAVRRSLALYQEGLGHPVNFSGRDTFAYSKVNLTQGQLDRLGDVVKDEGFLRSEVFPNIIPNAMVMERARREGSDPGELTARYFLDDDLVKWSFGTEGLVPRIESEYSSDFSSGIPHVKGGGFVLPYEDIPYIVTWGAK